MGNLMTTCSKEDHLFKLIIQGIVIDLKIDNIIPIHNLCIFYQNIEKKGAPP